MIMRLEFGYNQLKELRPEVYAQLRHIVSDLPEDQTQAQSYKEYEGDVAKVTALVGSVQCKGIVTPWLADTLANLATRITDLEKGLAKQDPKGSFNERVNVHVPGLGLLLMKQVKVLADCCTDALQDELNQGWRIIACCPQPDSRRPDYVLGHATPQGELNGSH